MLTAVAGLDFSTLYLYYTLFFFFFFFFFLKGFLCVALGVLEINF